MDQGVTGWFRMRIGEPKQTTALCDALLHQCARERDGRFVLPADPAECPHTDMPLISVQPICLTFQLVTPADCPRTQINAVHCSVVDVRGIFLPPPPLVVLLKTVLLPGSTKYVPSFTLGASSKCRS